MIGSKLSGTFSVTKIKRHTTLKGVCDLIEYDVFKINMLIRKSFTKRVECIMLINGIEYNYTLNEINLIFKDILEVQQIN